MPAPDGWKMATDKEIRLTIFRKMIRLEYIGGRHTSIDNLPKGFPRSERGVVIKVVRKMLKEGYLIVKVKPDSLHVSIDPAALPQIRREIELDE